jgi:hypothetical protein
VKLLEIEHCSKLLDFQPISKWPESFPAFSWRGFMLTAFDRRMGRAVDLHADLVDIISDCYPRLSLAEIARLSGLVSDHVKDSESVIASLLERYEIEDCDITRELLLALPKTPLSFQNWTSRHKFKSKELDSLRIFNEIFINLPDYTPLLERIAAFDCDQSTGAELLSLAIRLAENDTSKLDLLPAVEDGPSWLNHLKSTYKRQANLERVSEQKSKKAFSYQARFKTNKSPLPKNSVEGLS